MHASSSCCLVAIGRLQVTSTPNSGDLNSENSHEFVSRHSLDGEQLSSKLYLNETSIKIYAQQNKFNLKLSKLKFLFRQLYICGPQNHAAHGLLTTRTVRYVH